MPKAINRIQAKAGDETVVCRGRTPAGNPARIAREKFDRLREVILDVVPADGDGIPFARLPDLVKTALEDSEVQAIGSIGWHTTCVKLELEARGEIQRVAGSKPQRLRRK